MFKLFKIRSLSTVNKPKLDKEIAKFTSIGVTNDEDGIIVSLTSFPQRMYEIHYTLYSLLTQTCKPAKVILWLSNEEFPNGENDVPQKVLNLKKNGLTIEFCKNLYSYKKLIPALKMYPNNTIVTADDDIYYEKNWLEKLIKTHETNPNLIIAHRTHTIKFNKDGIAPYKKWKKSTNSKKISYLNFLTSGGGVLFPPNSLYKDVLNEELFTQLAPKADDVWFWAMAVLNGTKIKVAKHNITKLKYLNPERERGLTNEITLFATNKKGGNDEQIQKVVAHYPEILTKLIHR